MDPRVDGPVGREGITNDQDRKTMEFTEAGKHTVKVPRMANNGLSEDTRRKHARRYSYRRTKVAIYGHNQS